MKAMKLKSRPLFLLVLMLLIAACATSPMTGRQQLKLIPEDQIISMSFQQYSQVKRTSKLSTGRNDVSMIQRVGRRTSKAAEEFMREKQINLKMNWEFILIEDDKTVNAWCMPGGKVAFYTGILRYTKNDSGVAVVMGHEVGHALAQHGNERMSQALLVQLGGLTLEAAVQSKPEATRNLWLQAFGVGAQVGFLLPYSRTHEYEADYIGLILMARAGYDPEEAVSFWTRMSQSGGGKPPEFLSTHPADENRIAALKRHLPEAMQYYRASRRKK